MENNSTEQHCTLLLYSQGWYPTNGKQAPQQTITPPSTYLRLLRVVPTTYLVQQTTDHGPQKQFFLVTTPELYRHVEHHHNRQEGASSNQARESW